MTTMAPARGGLRGWHVLVTLVTFLLIVTAVDGVMIYDALSTFSGNETEDAYRKGVAYNQLIKAEEAQNRLGWSQSNTFEFRDRGIQCFVQRSRRPRHRRIAGRSRNRPPRNRSF